MPRTLHRCASVILLIDNYDSFTWNLVQCLRTIDSTLDVEVVRNDRITVAEAEALEPAGLLISPGPCTPDETGICLDLLRAMSGRVPILGVCLGHQSIAAVNGMDVVRSTAPMHGKTSPIHHDGRGIFQGLENPFVATRYHSLIVDRNSVPDDFDVSAWTADGTIMGLRWRGGEGAASIDGVQFHPESFLSVQGPTLLGNWLSMLRDGAAHVGADTV